jgi:hypothetical protein
MITVGIYAFINPAESAIDALVWFALPLVAAVVIVARRDVSPGGEKVLYGLELLLTSYLSYLVMLLLLWSFLESLGPFI